MASPPHRINYPDTMSNFNERLERESKTYRPSIDGDKMLAPDFAASEFACDDGTDVMLVHPALVRLVQTIRDNVAAPVTITSAFRTAAHNAKIGGADNSRHMYGLAADIVTPAATPNEVAAMAEDLGAGGVGRYDDFTHVDVWGSDRRWDRRS